MKPDEGIGNGKEGAQPRSLPSISLQKGGGAIRGMGEKFAANPVTGTGTMTVPIATSSGRSGFGPQLSLGYDSGAGNGPFGLGWGLTLPSISRKTEKGLPQYLDYEESDVFILSGAEDLVPELLPDGNRFEDNSSVPGFLIHRYRPRIEGLFARIERWTREADGDHHWRSITRDNFLTVYGKDGTSRIFDPSDPDRVFSWLICETRDDKGNAILYEYKPEDGKNVDLTQIHELNRGDRDSPQRATNLYIKRIRYGNRASLLDGAGQRPHSVEQADLQNADWMFEVVFDFGEHDADDPRPDDSGDWLCRNDPFSSYRSGFEVRSYRLCQRILMFHHFPSEPNVGADCLVRSTGFAYRTIRMIPDDQSHGHPILSFIAAVTQSGYKRLSDGGYFRKSMPPVEFDYSEAVIGQEIHDVDPDSLDNLPYGPDGSIYQWVDLDGEGVSGLLTAQGAGWFFKRNLSPLARGVETEQFVARFGAVESVTPVPLGALTTAGQWQFLDLAGDGQVDFVELDRPIAGFYERTKNNDWNPFRAFHAIPNLKWNDPNLRFIDLTGDGHADALITEDRVFTWYQSRGEEGFAPARMVSVPYDEERGPRVVFADLAQTIFLADLSGDGLTDIVRVRNGEVSYWPNLGYGRFGAKVAMDNAPWFETPDQFDPRRIRLADIDGSGVTDIIYLGRNRTRFWFNHSGNSWSAANELAGFPPIDNVATVAAVDLLGNGTASLVWSSALPGATAAPMKYINLMIQGKPHLMVRTRNNMGAETRLRYVPSTYFYLRDREAGRPWMTRLPFPVHAIERVETYDYVSHNRFVTRYEYHHGYFDGEEREFRGFGMVEQWDTEEFASLGSNADFPSGINEDIASRTPPVHTKTWFHTGVYVDRNHISDFFGGLLDEEDKGEYFREPGLNDAQAKALLLVDTVLPEALTAKEEREACRALKGSMLRQEVYGLDGTDKARLPYTVTEQNFTIRCLQPRAGNRHAVFFAHPRESINYHYERNPADPRISHKLTLEVEDFGNVLKECSIGYGRGKVDPVLPLPADRDKQTRTLVTFTENLVTNTITQSNSYRAPLPCETRSYELTGYPQTGDGGRFRPSDFVVESQSGLIPVFDSEVSYEDEPTIGRQRRLIEQGRVLYRKDDLSGLLPLGTLESLALPGESYKLAFTPRLLTKVFSRPRDGQPPENLLSNPAELLGGLGADQGGYAQSQNVVASGAFPSTDPADHWWTRSGLMFYSTNTSDSAAEELAHAVSHFFIPHRYRDPFHTTHVNTETVVLYDDHTLLMVGTRDPLGNTVRAQNDYRVLAPRLMIDPNGNRSEVAFDALGLVVGTAVMGKDGETAGDTLAGFEADIEATQVDAFYDALDPHETAPNLLVAASTRIIYDLDRFRVSQQAHPADPETWLPNYAATLARETHVSDPLPDGGLKVQISFSYSDGFGREIQKKIQAEPGPIVEAGPTVSPRWVASGWTVFNNKGKPVRQYEPFFSRLAEKRHQFEFGVRVGVSPVLFYDPLGRVVATLNPNHAWGKVVFDPWQETTWDVNDTVLRDPTADEDVNGFFGRLQDSEYHPTWHEARTNGEMGSEEKAAADKAAGHADTPAVAHLDTLGRPFLTVAHNRFARNNAVVDEKYVTRVALDIEGNQHEVIDAKDRTVMRYAYDIRGSRIHQRSMEAGARWLLHDVTGKPIRTWDSRFFTKRMTYDGLRRPTGLFVTENGSERLAETTVYGETTGAANNHRTRVHQVLDGAGVVTSDAYDFKGNVLRTARALLSDYKNGVDWQQNPTLDNETFVTSTSYDAVNRPVALTTPDESVHRATFNEANLLDKVDVNLRGASIASRFVENISYNARGQRTRIERGNGTRTDYDYDSETFNLTHLRTTRGGLAFQDLRYTYDPAGNITSIRDAAQQAVYFDGQVVEPNTSYVYDATYRLIEARGREHRGQVDRPEPNWDNAFRINLPHPHDGQAMRNYSERYEYDAAGNFERVVHQASNGNWTRDYAYDEPSVIEPTKTNNRLSSTTVGQTTETYSYDAHGSMLNMPHLLEMRWDFEDELQQVDLGGGGRAYYVYDATGRRVRKVIDAPNGSRRKERVYIGSFEVCREYGSDAGTATFERETVHIMDQDRRIAIVETKTIDSTTVSLQGTLLRYQLDNHLGSTCLELDDTGALVSYEEYYPHGSSSYQASRSALEANPKRYRYTGNERDEETGFQYHGARFYSPWLGRWTSCDPEGLVDGPNLFAYVRNNPLVLSDTHGTEGEHWVWKASRGRFKAITEVAGEVYQMTTPGQVATGILTLHKIATAENSWDKAKEIALERVKQIPAGAAAAKAYEASEQGASLKDAIGAGLAVGVDKGTQMLPLSKSKKDIENAAAAAKQGDVEEFFKHFNLAVHHAAIDVALIVVPMKLGGPKTSAMPRRVPPTNKPPATAKPQPLYGSDKPSNINTGGPGIAAQNCGDSLGAYLLRIKNSSTFAALGRGIEGLKYFDELRSMINIAGGKAGPRIIASSPANLIQSLRTFPAGSRFAVAYTAPGAKVGHFIAAEVEVGGGLRFVDPSPVSGPKVVPPPPPGSRIEFFQVTPGQ